MKYVTVEEQRQLLVAYAKENNRPLERILEDSELNFGLLNNISSKITLVVASVAVLGNRFEEIIKSVQTYTNLGISICFVREEILVGAEFPMSFSSSADICLRIFKGILSIKNRGIVADLRKSGRKVGRPFGTISRQTAQEGE